MKSYKGPMENIPYPGHKSFLEGREKVEDEPRAGRLSTSKPDDNVERVRSVVSSDRRLTLRMISSELNLIRFTVHQILTQDLDMRKVCAKMVPKNLTTEQKANRRDMCLDLLDRFEREPEFFSRVRVIAGDESWILEYDPETKGQIREWHTAKSSYPRKARISKSKFKSILICFFFWQLGDRTQGICATRTKCQSNFLPGSLWKTQGKGGTCATTHCTHLDAAPRQRPMSHGSLHQWIFGKKKKHFLWFLSPYSPDLSPCEFFLFLRLKNHLKVCHFGTLDNIKESVTDELKGIPAEAFQHCYEQRKQRLRRCVAAQRNYFEGYNLDS